MAWQILGLTAMLRMIREEGGGEQVREEHGQRPAAATDLTFSAQDVFLK
jgi:hypothetical protein